jgi:murein endopeptidase
VWGDAHRYAPAIAVVLGAVAAGGCSETESTDVEVPPSLRGVAMPGTRATPFERAVASTGKVREPPRRAPAIRWRQSRPLGKPGAGALEHGVLFPASGRHFTTWDPVLHRSPDREWRRWGTDRVVRLVLRVAREHRAANPGAPRVVVGDLSRPHGGDFGRRFGFPGHRSHQNGLDVDVYYPRLDRRERAPMSIYQIDQRLAQDLVDRFVRAGAAYLFVGPRTGLTGPPSIVQSLPGHDNHIHVRLPSGG